MRRAMLAMGVATGFLVLGALLLDEGEVVTLLTEQGGREHSTHLWIIEVDGRQYLRAKRPNASWLDRLRVNPEVGLRRASFGHGEAPELYRAFPVADSTVEARIDAEMARKYPLADWAWGLAAPRSESQVIELLPRAESADARSRPGAGP